MISDEQIATARRLARERQKYHEQNGDPDYQIADNLSGEEVHFRGLLGEFELQNTFGTKVDMVHRRGGDDGYDALLLINDEKFHVNVKCSTYLGSSPYLRVPKRELRPRVIYVAAHLDTLTYQVSLIGWEWGKVLAGCPQQSFVAGGALNYIKPYGELRSLDELKARVHPLAGFVGYDADGRFVHYCQCGSFGDFGYFVSLRNDRLGIWYCKKHLPANE